MVSQGSGLINEDAAGVIEHDGTVAAAWVFDGVTGINGRNFLDLPTDAAWIVERANAHLQELAQQDLTLIEILTALVVALKQDWDRAAHGIEFPAHYDVPATCLLLAKRYADGWRALRLGDSFLLTAQGSVKRWNAPESVAAIPYASSTQPQRTKHKWPPQHSRCRRIVACFS
jgi:hypothetical protein